VTGDVGNKPLMAAMLGKRSSGAAGTHADRRTRRRRTRSTTRQHAIRDQYHED
jgi:hypothetical protein